MKDYHADIGASGRAASSHRIVLKAEDLFANRRKRPVKTLVGIEVNLLARKTEMVGNIEITGDIPDDALLVVRDGSVRIVGYLFGNLVATGDIEVTENIHGGWVVSSQGCIEARRILARAKVIAQTGDVRCEGIENPDIVFANGQIGVDGDVAGGKLVTGMLCVDGTVNSAEIHAAGPALARSFTTHFSRSTIICLRTWLCSEDYGAEVSPEAVRIRHAMTKHRYHVSVIAGMVRYTHIDVLNTFRSMLYYLMSGVDNRMAVCRLRGAQTQVIYLDQIMEAGKALGSFLHSAKRSGGKVQAEEVAAVADECMRTLATIEQGIAAIPTEFGRTCRDAATLTVKQLMSVATNIKAATRTTLRVSKYLDMLDQYLVKWNALLGDATDEVRRLTHEFGMDHAVMKVIETEPAKLEGMLTQALADATRHPGSEPCARANSVFMRIMKRTVDRHRSNISNWRNELVHLRKRIRRQRNQLDNDPTIVLAAQGPDMIYVRASHFDKNVIITSEVDLLRGEGDGTGVGPNRYTELLARPEEEDDAPTVKVLSAIDADTTYVLRGHQVVRETETSETD